MLLYGFKRNRNKNYIYIPFCFKGAQSIKKNAENDAGMIYKNDYATMLLKSQTKKKKNWKATKEKINQT